MTESHGVIKCEECGLLFEHDGIFSYYNTCGHCGKSVRCIKATEEELYAQLEKFGCNTPNLKELKPSRQELCDLVNGMASLLEGPKQRV